jgi:hypothetical protein
MINSYKYFLLENIDSLRSDTTILSEKDFLYNLKNNCKEFSFDDKPIWRNSNLEDSYYLIDPLKYKRKSINISNYYTLLIDNSPYWKEYPKRCNSLIALLDGQEFIYGKSLYRVIPFDNAMFGVAPSDDLWFSFYNLVDNFNIKLKDLVTFIKIINKNINIEINDDDFNIFKTDIKKLEDFIKNKINLEKININLDIIEFQYFFNKYYRLLFKLQKELISGGNFIDFINNYLKPEDNNFELLNYKQLIKRNIFKYKNKNDFNQIINGNEVWTDSKCLLIHDDNIQNIKRKI